MKKFYFVGGPRSGQTQAFFQRLARIGGTPAGWQVYPHAGSDGKALHVVDAESRDEIDEHLERLADLYSWSEIVEIVERRPN